SRVPRRARRNGARPLNRRPKALSEARTLSEAAPSACGGRAPLRLRPVRGGRAPQGAPPGGTGGFTDEEAQLIRASGDGGGSDPAARERARQIAARLTLARPRYDATSRRGTGDLASVPYRGASADIDLDRTP